jgi:peptide/nickel transport system ATP-binding protein
MSDLIRATGLVKEFPVRRGLLDALARTPHRVVHAVDDVSFAIARGEVLALAGESGSGKSTTGRMLLRLLEPTAGAIEYDGRDLLALKGRELERLREKIQIVFQDPNSSLSPRMSVGEAIGHPLEIHGLKDRGARRRRVLEHMERVGLTPAEFLYRKYPHQISGGQCQRVVLARALVTEPDFVVADEPIAMADVSVRAMILELMRKLQREMGLTYLFITHDLATAKYLCDRAAIMYLGRIVEIGSREQIFGSPHHPYSRALLAAVPVPDPDFGKGEQAHARSRAIVPGEIPSAILRPPGCHFHPRCPLASAACRAERPPLKQVGPGHFSACVL